MTQKKFFAGILLTTLLFSSTSIVMAQKAVGEQNSTRQKLQLRTQDPTTPRKTTDGKERSCEAILKNTTTRSESLLKMARNMMSKFDAVQGSVENYYTGTVLPSGKKVANYQALTNDTKNKKDAVETALAKATEDLDTLSCEHDNPKEVLLSFNTNMKAVKTSLANYRTSIKNVIKAVHGFKRPTDKPRATFLPRQTTKPRPEGTIRQFSPKPDRGINPPSI